MKNTAISIFSFNRPEYLRKTLDSIEKAKNSHKPDYYFFQDHIHNEISGNTYGSQENVDRCLKIAEMSKLNFKNIDIAESNKSIALQKHKGHQLFKNYDNVFFFEDDLVIGKYYLVLLYKMLQQFPEYSCTMYADQNRGKIDEVSSFHGARLWGYGMTKFLWKKIKSDWKIYYEIMKNVDYRQKGKVPDKDKKTMEDIIGKSNVSHDITISNLIYKHGKGKLRPMVTRGEYIGKKGSYAFTLPHMWKKRDLHKQPETITHRKDPEITKFKLV